MAVLNGLRVRKVLVLRALMLGDMLAAIPALRALRQALPDAEITLVGLPWARTLMARYEYIDRFLEFPGFPGIRESPWDWDRLRQFVREAKAYRYDLVLQMHGDGTCTNSLAQSLGGRLTAGFYGSPDSREFLDLAIPYVQQEHEVLRLLALLRVLGISPCGTYLEFPLRPQDDLELARLLDLRHLQHPLVVIHVGSRVRGKRWDAERFAAVVRHVVSDFGASVVMVGAPEEVGVARLVRAMAGVASVDLVGRTTLGALAALIARADLFVGNDSGPAHIAAAVGVASVVVYRRSAAHLWAPLDRHRHRVVFGEVDCLACDLDHPAMPHRCLQAISAEEVVAHIEDLLAPQDSRQPNSTVAGAHLYTRRYP